MSRANNKEKYKEYDHNYYIKHKRPKSKIGQAELKIADIEAKLAESEEHNKILEEHKFYADNIIQAYADKCKNYEQQLAEKDAEIETLNKFLRDKADEIEKITCDYKRQLSASNILTQAIKIREHNQDKISFAVEQLEKVKTRIQEDFDYDDLMYWLNKQIKMLKEGK